MPKRLRNSCTLRPHAFHRGLQVRSAVACAASSRALIREPEGWLYTGYFVLFFYSSACLRSGIGPLVRKKRSGVQESRTKTRPMRLQGLRSVDRYFTGLSGLPHYAALGPGSSGSGSCSSAFFAFSAISRSVWHSPCFLTATVLHRIYPGPRHFARLVRPPQPDEVRKPQYPAPNLIGPRTRIPAAYWCWNPRRIGHRSHPWHSRPSRGWSGAFH